MVHVGKGVYINISEIAYYCPARQAPGDLVIKATDVSSGTRRCLVVLNNKINLLVDITAETLGRRIRQAQGRASK